MYLPSLCDNFIFFPLLLKNSKGKKIKLSHLLYVLPDYQIPNDGLGIGPYRDLYIRDVNHIWRNLYIFNTLHIDKISINLHYYYFYCLLVELHRTYTHKKQIS